MIFSLLNHSEAGQKSIRLSKGISNVLSKLAEILISLTAYSKGSGLVLPVIFSDHSDTLFKYLFLIRKRYLVLDCNSCRVKIFPLILVWIIPFNSMSAVK